MNAHRLMRPACSMIIAFLAATAAHASHSAGGYVSKVDVTDGGVIIFNQDGQRSPSASCQATGNDQLWSFDATTPAGQAKLAMLLTAHAQHERVEVGGEGSCTAWADIETLSYIVADD